MLWIIFMQHFVVMKKFPYHEGEYVLIEETTMNMAYESFKDAYPNPRAIDVANCAFIYNELEFDQLRRKYPAYKELPVAVVVNGEEIKTADNESKVLEVVKAAEKRVNEIKNIHER